ncbi:MAG: U32 family peptidase [Nanoarchaeota archaeon]|nr:U32 family peptidase [Nanoarchaeota archaeon]
MKILSPLSNPEEVKPLCAAGADQFYCGLVHKNEALNDRPNTSRFSFSNIDELSKAVDIANKLRKDVFLAINNMTPSLDAALDQARIAEKLGIKGVIVSNPLVMKRIREEKLKLDVCASCLTGALNSQGINFFQKLGAKLIHLPRHVGIKDLEMISNNLEGIELSVFGMNGMCINIEAYCSLHYLKNEYFIPCNNFKTIELAGEGSLSKTEINKKINSPKISCGICAFKRFKKIGISSIKIEGRGISTNKKIINVSIVKEALDLANENVNDADFHLLCKRLFKKHFNEDCKVEYCYF